MVMAGSSSGVSIEFESMEKFGFWTLLIFSTRRARWASLSRYITDLGIGENSIVSLDLL